MTHHIQHLFIIAKATTLEAIRNRILWITLAFALGLVLFSVILASISLNERDRLILDISLFATSGMGSLIAIALAVTSFANDLQRHTAYMILVRPIPRWVFVVGKYLGIVATMALIIAMMFTSTALTLWLYGSSVPLGLVSAAWLTLIDIAVVTSVAIAFSTFAVPVLATTYTIGIIVAGHLAQDIQDLAHTYMLSSPLASHVLDGFFYVMPDLQAFSLRHQLANALPISDKIVVYATCYGAFYILVVLIVGSGIFTRRKTI